MSTYLRGKIYWTKFTFDGRQIRQSTGKAKKKDAETYERNLRAHFEKDAEAAKLGRPLARTFGQALAKWIEGGAPKSMYSHARCVREHMENVELSRSIPAANDMKQAMLADNLSPQTINRRLAVVRRVLNLAYKSWEWLREPLGQRVEMLSEKGLQREVFLTAAEVTSFFQTMKNDEAKRFILLESWTGMRKSEIRRLTPESWRAPIIMLSPKTKSGKARPIPLVESMHWIMEHLPFTISEWDLRKDFEEARAALEMEHVRMHDLRHTFASWLVENPDIPLTVVRDLLGHSSLAVTSKYSHLRTGVLEDAILSLSGHKKRHTQKRKTIRKRAQVID